MIEKKTVCQIVEELRKRLQGRGTDAPEVIESRIAKAEFEFSNHRSHPGPFFRIRLTG